MAGRFDPCVTAGLAHKENYYIRRFDRHDRDLQHSDVEDKMLYPSTFDEAEFGCKFCNVFW
jgi:hypothetical protein